MREVATARDHYQAEFDHFAAHRALAAEPAWLLSLRRNAAALLAERGFPTSRDEEWRYTSVAKIVREPLRLFDAAPLTARELAGVGVDLWDGPQLVFVNGYFAPDLSSVGALPAGVTVTALGAAVADPLLAPLAERVLARGIVEPHGFAALCGAFATDGAFVHVPARTVLPQPIHLVFATVATGAPGLCAVRNVVVADRSSQCTIVESYLTVGPGKPLALTCAITCLDLADDAVVDHLRVQREGQEACHVASHQARLARDASLRSGTYTLGGSLVRNDFAAVLAGEGAECRLAGLFVASRDQQVDNRTVVDHAVPHCASDQLFKGIVQDAASGTFSGKIVVREGAAKTDARQSSKNLQLSRTAAVHTKPQLEIYNDDVKCSHGASIGQLDAEALFYLRSRGLGLDAARALLTYAFAGEVVEGIPVPAVRAAVAAFLLESLPAGDNEVRP
ncbi:MAG: Fe-S cluster assembly protein SufD [Candidatus Sericytochromatia bacterium]|nr:Fe-S cluster assembly protein SufD [Candidatus Tanganyikabacteria bacterium]